MSELIEIYKKHIEKEKKSEIEFHLHQPNKSGGSRVLGCIFQGGMKLSGHELPEKTGIKNDTGAMDIGRMWHEHLYSIFKPYFTDPDEIFGTEIYVRKKLKSGLELISPIDIAIVSPPGFIEVKILFKNGPKNVLMKHPKAKWLRIYDVKSASDNYSYWKYKNERLLTPVYEGQMELYCKATGLPFMDVLFVNKGTGAMFFIRYEEDHLIWMDIENNMMRKQEIAGTIAQGKKLQIKMEDFSILVNQSDFECRYCELSHTHEDVNEYNNNKPKLVLDKSCNESYRFIREVVLNKFRIGDMWKRGRSHVTIKKIWYESDEIESINKSGTVYQDSFFYYFSHVKERLA